MAKPWKWTSNLDQAVLSFIRYYTHLNGKYGGEQPLINGWYASSGFLLRYITCQVRKSKLLNKNINKYMDKA